MADIIFNALGLFGVFLILLFYFLMQSGRTDPHRLPYLLGNLIGSFSILVSLFYDWNLASFVVEVFWVMISLYGLVRYFRREWYAKPTGKVDSATKILP